MFWTRNITVLTKSYRNQKEDIKRILTVNKEGINISSRVDLPIATYFLDFSFLLRTPVSKLFFPELLIFVYFAQFCFKS